MLYWKNYINKIIILKQSVMYILGSLTKDTILFKFNSVFIFTNPSGNQNDIALTKLGDIL